MSVWLAIPSKRPPEQAEPVLRLWRERGYKIALVVDSADEGRAKDSMANFIMSAPEGYRGYARSVNALAGMLIAGYADAEWIVTGGDDVEPDANRSAEEIARECSAHFNDGWVKNIPLRMGPAGFEFLRLDTPEALATFGVMQPTGDRWGDNGDGKGSYSDRVCGSPWLGREFCKRMYGGRGPLYEGYTHMFEDEELQAVAMKLGVLWQRRDLIHYHRHWGRPKAGERLGDVANMPEFLKEANSPEHWKKYRAMFEERQAAGFPGHEPLC